MRDLLRKRRVERHGQLRRPLETGAERIRSVWRECRLPHRLLQVVDERMNAGDIPVEDRRPMIESVERRKRHIELRESGGCAAKVRSAVFPERFARYPCEQGSEATVDNAERVAVVAGHRPRDGEAEFGRRELLQELVFEALLRRLDDVRVDPQNKVSGVARHEVRRVLVPTLGLHHEARPWKSPGIEDRVDVAGRLLHGCVPLSRRFRSSVSSWKVECSMSKSPRRQVSRSSSTTPGSAPRCITTCAEITFMPLVMVHTCRS